MIDKIIVFFSQIAEKISIKIKVNISCKSWDIFFRYCLVGVLATIVDFFFLYTLTEYLGIWYLYSGVISFVLAALTNYFLNRKWTFNSQDPRFIRQISIFFLVVGIGLLINNTILYFLVEYFAMWYIWARVFSSLANMIWNFLGNKNLTFKHNKKNMDNKICIVGLGYVGLPLACLLSKEYEVSGFDVDEKKIEELNNGHDRTNEIKDLKQYGIKYSFDPNIIKESNIIIVAVPTPIDEHKNPDLTFLKDASRIVGRNLRKGSIVTYESTVYPGCTEEICIPILENESGLKFNQDFSVGYSPERINPGDFEHPLDKIIKVVSASNKEALDTISKMYSSVITAGVHPVSSIKAAEATKILENVQRDSNIALMNEISMIFNKLDIDTKEVIEAADTKWNFVKYSPGLVGGHCISVDPYYLTNRSIESGLNPKFILMGREVNDYMPTYVANQVMESLKEAGKELSKSRVLILGLTFKEDVPDLRNSKAKELLVELKRNNVEVLIHDPIANPEFISSFFGQKNNTIDELNNLDAIIVFSPHKEFKELTLEKLKSFMNEKPILFDVKRFYNKEEAKKLGKKYLSL